MNSSDQNKPDWGRVIKTSTFTTTTSSSQEQFTDEVATLQKKIFNRFLNIYPYKWPYLMNREGYKAQAETLWRRCVKNLLSVEEINAVFIIECLDDIEKGFTNFSNPPQVDQFSRFVRQKKFAKREARLPSSQFEAPSKDTISQLEGMIDKETNPRMKEALMKIKQTAVKSSATPATNKDAHARTQ